MSSFLSTPIGFIFMSAFSFSLGYFMNMKWTSFSLNQHDLSSTCIIWNNYFSYLYYYLFFNQPWIFTLMHNFDLMVLSLSSRLTLLELAVIHQRICGPGNMRGSYWQQRKQMKPMICTNLTCSRGQKWFTMRRLKSMWCGCISMMLTTPKRLLA